MRFARIIRQRLRSLFLRRAVEAELDEELSYHLERQIDEAVAHGASREEARIAALREFQQFEQRKEECRDMRRWNVFDNLRQDLRYAIRQLLLNPGFTTTAILVLAFGLCASMAIFAFVDAALIQPLPYRDPSRLVAVYESVPICPRCDVSYFDYLDWKKLSKSFSSLEVYHNIGSIVTTPSGAEPAPSVQVSSGFFQTLGVSPILGRAFQGGEDRAGAPHLAILSNSTWRKRFGGKEDVIGTKVILDSTPFVVIGVLPASFHFAPAGLAEFWTPIDPAGFCAQRRGCHNLYGVARLKDGVSTESAQADTKVIAGQLEREYPATNRGQGAAVVPLAEAIVGNVRPILLILLGGAALLLLIACVNVANLLLVRSEGRRREVAVRGALGASRWRLISQFVAEGVVLVTAGNLLGLTTTVWAIQLLTRLVPQGLMAGLPFLAGLGLSLRVVAFAIGVSLLETILFALPPTLHLSFAAAHGSLTESGRWSTGGSWRRLGSKLVALELTIAMILLVSAGLLGQSVQRLLRVQLGFQPDHLETLSVAAQGDHYQTFGQVVSFARTLVSEIERMPGARSVALTTLLPVGTNGNTEWVRVVDHPFHGEHWEVNKRQVSSEYFATLGAKLVRGRAFNDDEDRSKPRVTIINQALAKKFFPGEDPIGKQIGDIDLSPTSIKTIVGVVEDIRDGQLDSEVRPAAFVPFNQNASTQFSVTVRTTQAPESVLPSLVRRIHEMDNAIVTLQGMSMEERIKNSPSAYARRSAAALVGAFAAVAMLLSVVGLYGVIAYSVSQRTREIGVRMALGAEPSAVYKMIFREAGIVTAIGIFTGVAASLGVTRLIREVLFGIEPGDVRTLLVVSLVLASAALAASFVPARRAAGVNPVDALRAE